MTPHLKDNCIYVYQASPHLNQHNNTRINLVLGNVAVYLACQSSLHEWYGPQQVLHFPQLMSFPIEKMYYNNYFSSSSDPKKCPLPYWRSSLRSLTEIKWGVNEFWGLMNEQPFCLVNCLSRKKVLCLCKHLCAEFETLGQMFMPIYFLLYNNSVMLMLHSGSSLNISLTRGLLGCLWRPTMRIAWPPNPFKVPGSSDRTGEEGGEAYVLKATASWTSNKDWWENKIHHNAQVTEYHIPSYGCTLHQQICIHFLPQYPGIASASHITQGCF